MSCNKKGITIQNIGVIFREQGDGSCVSLIFNNSERREGTVLLLPLKGVK